MLFDVIMMKHFILFKRSDAITGLNDKLSQYIAKVIAIGKGRGYPSAAGLTFFANRKHVA